MVENILTIDCDVLTNCHTYAPYTLHNVEASECWDIINHLERTGRYGINTEVDIRYLTKVCDVLKNKCVGSEVRLIGEHHEIIDIMEEFGCKDTSLYNIDAHIDINYGNDNTELNCENFVLHAKSRRLVDKYYWIHTTNSDINTANLSPFKFTRCNLEDLDISMLPHFDLVVICISRHFTPMRYWESLPSFLMSYIVNIGNFKEVSKDSLTYDMVKNYNDFLIDGSMPNIERLFRYKDCFIIYEDDTHNVSIINLGESFNILCSKEVVDYLLKTYKELKFTYVEGIRNVVLINRLLKNYSIVDREEDEYKDKKVMTITFKESD